MSINYENNNITGSGSLFINNSGNFVSGLYVNSVPVSLSGHTHLLKIGDGSTDQINYLSSDRLNVIGTGGTLVLYNDDSNTITISGATNLTDVVFTTGNQNISGTKTFYDGSITNLSIKTNTNGTGNIVFVDGTSHFGYLSWDGTNHNLIYDSNIINATFDLKKPLRYKSPSTGIVATSVPVFTGGNPSVSVQTISARSISDFKSDLSLDNVQNLALSGITFTAGSGLSGGGSLSSDTTFDIGQGDGVSILSDSISVDSTVVRTTGLQSISGVKTFLDQITASGNIVAPTGTFGKLVSNVDFEINGTMNITAAASILANGPVTFVANPYVVSGAGYFTSGLFVGPTGNATPVSLSGHHQPYSTIDNFCTGVAECVNTPLLAGTGISLSYVNGTGLYINASGGIQIDSSSSGFVVKTGINNYTTRYISNGHNINISYADGVSGNPTIGLSGNLDLIQNITSTGNLRANSGIFSSGITLNGTGVVLTNRKINTSSGIGGGSDLLGDITIGLTGLAYNLNNISNSGFIVTTGNNGVTTRIITASGANIWIGSGNGVSGNPIIGLNPYTSGLDTLQASYLYSNSGYFNNLLQVNGTGVSLSGHKHIVSDITNFAIGVSGLLPTGTVGYIPKFGNGGSGLNNSIIIQSGNFLGIGTNPQQSYILNIDGDLKTSSVRIGNPAYSTFTDDGFIFINSNEIDINTEIRYANFYNRLFIDYYNPIVNITGNLNINGTGVSISGHTHNISSITDFGSGVSGLLPTGNANYIPKFGTGGSGLSNSVIYQSGNNIGIGTTTPSGQLHVIGTGLFSNSIGINTNSNSVGATPYALLVDGDVSVGSGNAFRTLSVWGNNTTKRLVLKNINGNSFLTYLIGSQDLNLGGPQPGDYPFNNINYYAGSTSAGMHRFHVSVDGTGLPPVMVITNSGVGIGTTTPSGRLHVLGTGLVDGRLSVSPTTAVTSPLSVVHISGNVTDNASLMISGPTITRTYLGIGNSDTIPFLSTLAGDISTSIYGWGFFDRGSNGFLNIQRKGGNTSWSSVMTMARTNGNVGIGTGVQATEPPEKLTVDGNIRVADTSVTQGNIVQFTRGGGNQYDYSIGKYSQALAISLSNDSTTQRPLQVGYHSGTTFLPQFHVNGYNGSVGIGTTTPSAQLHVVGSGLFASGLNVNGNINIDNNQLYINKTGIFLPFGSSLIPAIKFSGYFSNTYSTMDNVICNQLEINNNLYISTSEDPQTSPGLFFSTNGEGVAGISSNPSGDTVTILANNLRNSLVASATFDSFGINTENLYATSTQSQFVNTQTIAAQDLLVKQGVIKVNNSYNNAYSMTINSSGINIVYNAGNAEVKYTDPVEFPTSIVTNNSIDSNVITNDYFIQTGFQIGELVLFKEFTAANAVYNGIYSIQNTSPVVAGNIRLVRASGYTNGTTLNDGFSVNVSNNNRQQKYVLNGTSIIGTNNLIFSPDLGQSVMNVELNKDVSFTQGIYAKEKYFKIQHPNPDSGYSFLQYGSLESPYHGVRLTGKDKLKNGVCEILLPDYLKYLIHEEDVSIQLTNYGHHKILYVDKIDLKNNKFIVKGYRSKSGGPFNFYWSFTGIRKDVPNLIPEQ